MSQRTEFRPTSVEESLRLPSLCAAFQTTAAARADLPALRTHGEGGWVTWGAYRDRVERVARGLHALGVRHGDRVGILVANRPEFHVVDTALLHLGAAPFSIYHTNPAAQILPLIDNSGARLIITEEQFAGVIREVVAARSEQIDRVIGVSGTTDDDWLTLEDVEERGDPTFDFEGSWRAVSRSTLATLVYTSGTTGPPKAVQFPHETLFAAVVGMHELYPVSPGGRTVSYLPLAHIAGRYMTHYRSFFFGEEIVCVPDPARIFDAFRATQQTWFFAVPRVWEKLAVEARQLVAGDERLEAALATGLRRVRRERTGSTLSAGERAESEEALVALEPVRRALGVAEIEWAGVATAPSAVDVLELWAACGIPVSETWGMSECMFGLGTSGARREIGTVGRPIPGMEIALAGDGELLVRGGTVFPGYFRDEERTREVLDDEGWLHSGDLGARDEAGIYRIVGRKKEIMINSAGKNMSPANIESAVKSGSPLVEHVVAVGDGRRYVTALLTLDPTEVSAFAARQGLHGTFEELVVTDEVQEAIAEAIVHANGTLARVEQVRGWRVLADRWEPGGEELTSTEKVKRRAVVERYADLVDELYAS